MCVTKAFSDEKSLKNGILAIYKYVKMVIEKNENIVRDQ